MDPSPGRSHDEPASVPGQWGNLRRGGPLDLRVRAFAKRLLRPLLTEGNYKYFQSVAMAWDIRSGRWREPELDLVPLALRDGETAVDVGACFGLYTHYMSRAVGPRGCVHAFEPVPATYGTLALVARLLGFHNVTLRNQGASDRAERVTFSLPMSDGVFSTALAHIDRRDNDRPGKEDQIRFDSIRRVECDVVRLDDVLATDDRVALLKCDVEGAEVLVMRGARAMLARCHPSLILEVNPWFLQGFGTGVDELWALVVDELGYAAFAYEAAAGRLVPQQRGGLGERNYLFVHPSRADRFASLTR